MKISLNTDVAIFQHLIPPKSPGTGHCPSLSDKIMQTVVPSIMQCVITPNIRKVMNVAELEYILLIECRIALIVRG